MSNELLLSGRVNRQYIGARYTIKVYENSQDPSSAEWESGFSYEPFTMVTYQNSSYLSRKAVPASVGNPAANPTYWVITGAYNGQIAQLQRDVAALQTAVAGVDVYEKFRNKKICIIGDSISAYTTLANNWAKMLTDFMDEYNCTVVNQAQDGQSFAGLANDISGGTFTVEPADYYIVFLGTNYDDSWGYTTGTYPLNPALGAVCNAIRAAANTDAKFFYVSPLKKFLANTPTLLNPVSVMRNLLELQMQYQGYTVISGYNIGELNAVSKTRYMTDGIHPTEEFSPILFNYILDGLVSERSNITQPASEFRTFTNTISANSLVSIHYTGLRVTIDITAYSFAPATGEWVDICDLPTLVDGSIAPFITLSSCGGYTTHQFRCSGNKLQAYFFSAPATSFKDGVIFDIIAQQGC